MQEGLLQNGIERVTLAQEYLNCDRSQFDTFYVALVVAQADMCGCAKLYDGFCRELSHSILANMSNGCESLCSVLTVLCDCEVCVALEREIERRVGI